MSVNLDAQCFVCHLRRNVETARSLGDEATATAFARELLQLYLTAPENVSSIWLGPATAKLFETYYGLEKDRFRQEKKDSNAFAMARLEQVRQRIAQAQDPVYGALQFAILGNYIDFSALQGELSFDALDAMLADAGQIEVEKAVYDALCRDLSQAKHLLYITDNAGEIAFDRLLAEQIVKTYPNVAVTFLVRGAPAMNDATREDAAEVGIPFPVIDNGTDYAGTDLTCIGPEAKQALENADVIVSKGQGNVETMLGCGYNIYYAFLVKCPRFVERFGKPKLTPMLVRERQ